MGGVLAIDYGTRKTGFAVADPLRIAVRPLETCRVDGASDGLLEQVRRILDDRDVSVLLVGLPLNMDATEGPQAAEVRRFVERLRTAFPALDVRTYDERLTTKEAEGRLREEGFGRREIAALKDSWSAWVLLRDWIDSGEPEC